MLSVLVFYLLTTFLTVYLKVLELLDYQVITPGLVDSIRDAWVYNDERFSDHAPFIMDYDGSL